MVGRDRRTRLARMLRIGCVKYLNARPLIRGWPGEVEFDHPSALCKRLADGELDVALVSSFEFLRNPIYRIVDDVSISSDGPVYSVVVAHHGDLSEIKEIEVDPASQTGVNLLRCLLNERGLNPRFIRAVPGSTGSQPVVSGSLPDAKARFLIGDQAIRFRQSRAGEFQFWDLGEQWKDLIGLPFVYALWLIRPKVADSRQIANRLRALRKENLSNLDALIAEEKDFNPQFCSRYYRKHLRFSFGEKENKGLRTFADLCAKHSLLEKRDLALDLV
ncbi:MAG TPA: menaquinone biosynthesis protein [Candidatus Udaeobacter sp.]|jgi:predicted solute-binding protein